MATSKPRIVISCSQARHDLIHRLSHLQGQTMSKTVSQLIDQVEPMLMDICAALEAAQQAKGKPAAKLIMALSQMQAVVQDASARAVDQVDMFNGKIARQIAKAKAKAPTLRKTAQETRRRAAR